MKHAPKKKLIEVALPLEDINIAAAKEKSIRHGHPSTLHLWWARRPLAACRAVLFASIVDDPSSHPDKFPTEEAQEAERQRLFGIIRRMVPWENSNDPHVLAEVREEIRRACIPPCPPETADFSIINEEGHSFNGYEWVKKQLRYNEANGEVMALQELYMELQRTFRSTGGWEGTHDELRAGLFFQLRNLRQTGDYLSDDSKEYDEVRSLYQEIRHRWDEVEPELPPVLDPFCGGGSIPLEAQRLGLKAHGSDLNPIAVLITKALIEIPSKFAGAGPVNPSEIQKTVSGSWKGASGLAADIRYYGEWMRDEAQRRIGHLYPQVTVPNGGRATVIAWIWARTIKCANPACGAQMPLVRSWALSTRKGGATWVEPSCETIDGNLPRVKFEIKNGTSVPTHLLDGTVNRQGAMCVCCCTHAKFSHIRQEAKSKRMDTQLIAVVAEGARQRIYLEPVESHELCAEKVQDYWKPNASISHWPGRTNVVEYGMTTWGDLFTPRQLTTITTYSNLVKEVQEKIAKDAGAAGMPTDNTPLQEGGVGAKAYAEAVGTYLSFAVDKLTDTNSTVCTWQVDPPRLRATFARQAIPMTWDFAEANTFGSVAGDFQLGIESLCKVVERLVISQGKADQVDATQISGENFLISTDPPYYDNIGYADLSDYFYVWLRRTMSEIYPQLFATLLTPKSAELVAKPYRFEGKKQEAEEFFESGLGKAFQKMNEVSGKKYPLTVYYAFKQAEVSDDKGVASTGWETMLEGLIKARFQITGTWPMRSELSSRSIARDSNALASSIVLVCRPRPENAEKVTRNHFLRELRRELPDAIRKMQHGNIAPVDFAQASIGPGMGIFSRFTEVQELDGSPLTVRTALALINQTLDEVLSEQEGNYDNDTRWAVAWFEQHGMDDGPFGTAETLSTAKVTAVSGLVEAGIITAKAGKVRLLSRSDLPSNWHPSSDTRLTVWETCQHLIRSLLGDGEAGAGKLLSALVSAGHGETAEKARDLAYRLYSTCERKKWSQEAIPYNSLVIAWPNITAQSTNDVEEPQQGALNF